MKINENFGERHANDHLRQILRIMKVTILIMTVFLLQVSASTNAQITITAKKETMRNVLKKISKQSGYDLVYTNEDMDKASPVNLKLNDVSIERALSELFKGQPLVYEVSDKTVMIKIKDEKTYLETVIDRFQAIDISGIVVDEKNIPLPGATVKAKGAKSVITDIKGRFMLENVEDGATVIITYTGYVTQELPAKQAMGVIKMALSDNPLDQVQVIAYGTQTKRYSLGNVVSVKAEDIEKQPVQNPLLALQGRVAGLEITQANGLNGSGVKVRIQGTNSIRNGTDPLIIIDGMPYASQTLSTTNIGGALLGYSGDLNSEASRGGAGSPLNYISPSDIESIEVLKDADATAIYGSRAANGAILITTKKGKAGETQFDFNLQQGWGSVRKFMDVLNTQQYLEMRREAFKNDGATPGSTDYDLNGHWDANSYTDWQKELIGGTAQYQNAILTLSGGNNTTSFRLSGTYNRRGTVFPGRENGNPSGNIHFAINSTSANQKFNAQFSGSFMSNINRLPMADLTPFSIQMAPNTPSLYNVDGSLNWAPDAAGNSTIYNPLANTEAKYKNKTTNMVSSLTLGYKLLEGLELKTNVGYTNQQINEFSGIPLSIYPPEYRITGNPGSLREARYSNSNISSWNIEPQLTYKRTLGLHQFNVLLGGSVQQRFGNGITLSGRGYNNDFSLENPQSAATIRALNTVIPVYKYVGAFARLNYQLKERYLVNLTMRRDGSTRFGPSSRFHNFGSIAAGWIFSEEKLVKQNLPFLSFGKIRASFGTTGNDQIADYLYMSLVNTFPVSIAYQGTVGYTTSRLANAHLEWEENRKLQMGIDLGFFNERVLVTANYLRNRTSNQLLPYNLPSIAGSYEVESNFPATLQNKGLEMELQTVNIKTQSFQWRTSINLSIIRNKLVEFPNLENSTYANVMVVGKPFNILRTYQFVGLDPATGKYQIAGKNGPTSSFADAVLYATVVNPNPQYYGGLKNSVNYRKISLDFLISFAKKEERGYFPSVSPGRFNTGQGNQPVAVLNRWKQVGDVAENQKFTQGTSLNESYSLLYISNKSFVDASFISLKNVSLSYQLPQHWVQKTAFKSATIYSHAQNLWTFTKYKGFDPESPGIGLPPLRIITLGIQASL